MKTKRRLDGGLLFLCGGLLLFFGAWLILSPQHSFSEEERRALTVLSAPSAEEVIDGRFTKRVGRFFSDQFPLRKEWVGLKARWEKISFRGENHGILFGKEGYLIPRGEYDSLEVAERNLRAIERAAKEAQYPLLVSFVPRSVDVLEEYLPTGFDPSRAQTIWQRIEETGIQTVDLRSPLRESAEKEIFYRTDHHWTSEGAYLGYRAICEALGEIPYDRNDFTQTEVSHTFLGSSDAASGGIAEEADRITLWRYEGDEKYLIEGETGDLHLTGFYDALALGRKDQYEVFLGGNRGRMTVRSETEKGREKLLLIKDSFSNSLIPFLARHYDLEVIDPRYYEGTLGALLTEESYDKILILWGADTLATDPSLGRLFSFKEK